jgi:general secretion pathway protein K
MRCEPAERGFALLVVLWWTALLALLGTQLATAGRLEAQRAGNLRSAAMARAAADGVLQEAVFHLLDGSPVGWAADGAPHVLPVAGGLARVEIRSEAAKVGLNQASPGLLAALLTRLGTSPRQAAALADAILDWRTATPRRRALGAKAPEYRAAGQDYAPPNSDFETLDELRLVRGMTPDILARMAPYVSVYQFGDPDLALADTVVRLASADAGDVASDGAERAGLPDVDPVVAVMVSVEMADGARAARRTVVRLALDASRRPFQILDQE